MRLFDSHCHFECADADAIRARLERARAAGVERVLAVGGSESLNAAAIVAATLTARPESAAELPRVEVALGFDRDQVADVESLERGGIAAVFASAAAAGARPVAVGEIGLDYHYSAATAAAQRRLFAAQLAFAAERGLPVVIHTREADADTLALLKEIPSRGIIHCYTGSPRFAEELLALGFYISISGIVTFRSAAEVRETAKMIPAERLLIETDSPYLAPVPLRGRENEPAFIVHTCEFLARLRGVSAAELAERTFANAGDVTILKEK